MSDQSQKQQSAGQFIANDGEPIQVKILNGGFAAALYVPDDENAFPSLTQVQLAIEKAEVNFGINDKAIDKLVKEEMRGKGLIFAKGTLPGDGGGARIVWNQIAEDGASPQDITELVNTTLRLQFFNQVKKGDQILSKLPATLGAKGINVFGNEEVIDGNDIEIPAGEGTQISSDGLTLVADQDGIAHWDGNVVTVTDMKIVEGDLDGDTGDIKTDGSIFIAKNVTAGLRLEAVGDIFIGGDIEGADVYSRTGCVRIRGGVNGQSRTRILGGASVIAAFIKDATVGAKENVEVGHSIINSAVTAGWNVTAMSNEGLIRGGNIFAEKKIEMLVAGSERHAVTELRVGFTPPEEQTKEKYQLRADQRRLKLELAYVQKRLAFLNILKQRMGVLTPDKEEQFKDLEKKELILKLDSKRHDNLADELEKRQQDQPDVDFESETIRVHDTVFNEVVLGIGDAEMVMNKERHNLLIYRTEDILSYGPLDQAMKRPK